ncbi:MAG: carboxypeptidase-like regulatory domain-containing protein [Planctomycetota bacterium]
MRRTPALLLLALTLVVTGSWLWQTREPGLPLAPPPAGATATSPPTAAEAAPAASAPHGDAPVGRQAIAAAGVFGVALDFAGQPLPEVQVYLLAVGRPAHERLLTRADREGRFAFADADGELLCGMHNHLQFEQPVSLAHGERRDIELRATEPCVLLTGRLLRGGHPVAGRHVRVTGADAAGDVDHTDVSDDDGAFRHLLRPGDYRMTAAGPPTEVRFELKGNEVWSTVDGEPTADASLRLGPTPTRVSRDLALPTGSLDVRLQAPTGAIEAVVVTVTDAAAPRRAWTRRGGGMFLELAPGDYDVAVSSPLFVATPPQRVTIGVAPQRLDVVLQPAGSLLVKVHWRDELIEAPNGSGLVLRHGGERFFGQPHRGGMWRYEGHRFSSLPPGRHLLSCEDTVTTAGVRHAAFEPFGPIALDVVAGETSEHAVELRPRAMLHFLVIRDNEAFATEITVVGATGPLAPLESDPGAWHGFVPPGDYEVRIAADPTGPRKVHVDHSDVTIVHELPATTGR